MSYTIKMKTDNALEHHGILGQKWGQQNGPPYPLDEADHSLSERKLAKLDNKWLKKNEKKIRKYAEKATGEYMKQYSKQVLDKSGIKKYSTVGKLTKTYINQYNRELANMMTQSIAGLKSPSGKVVAFVALRGEKGVLTALADPNYDLSQLSKGVYSSGKVAYKKKVIESI